jgi:hypothetical protein
MFNLDLLTGRSCIQGINAFDKVDYSSGITVSSSYLKDINVGSFSRLLNKQSQLRAANLCGTPAMSLSPHGSYRAVCRRRE